VSDDLVTGWLEMMRACNRLTQSIERELAREHRLCVSAYELMSALVPATGWTRLVELTERVSRSQPQVSRLVAQMEAAGVLQRTASPDDGRGTQVRLTEAGRDLYAAATATIGRILRDAAFPAVRFPPPTTALRAGGDAARAGG
jgi:DNA-binding MarR family transcriptional regulator